MHTTPSADRRHVNRCARNPGSFKVPTEHHSDQQCGLKPVAEERDPKLNRYRRSTTVVAAAATGAVRALNPAPARRWPARINDWSARAYPNGRAPIVLVPGSFVPGQLHWHRIAPMLLSEGHPVFACNLPGWGTRSPDTMVDALDSFVERVNGHTGTNEVILIGQSFGGVIIRDLLQRKAMNVPAAITISSQHHGFRRIWNRILRTTGVRLAFTAICPMALELVSGSDYLTKINTTGHQRSRITTVASTFDAFAPLSSTEIPDATNIVLQEIDPSVRSGHMLIGYDPLTVEVIRRTLADVS